MGQTPRRLRRGTYQGADLYATALHLTAAPPYQVPLDAIQLRFMHGDVPAPHLLGAALNCAVVGLASAARMAQSPNAPPPCLGVGLVRAVDMRRRVLYLLTPLPEEAMREVGLLLVGRAAGELPSSLLQAGQAAAAAPYLSLFALGGVSGAAAGATAGKARRNVGRSRLEGGA